MKKKLLILGGVILGGLILVLILSVFFLGSIVKKGVETVGPMITKTPMKLEGANIGIFTGSGSLNGFLLGNPAGYKTEAAIKVAKVSLGVKPGSLFSDKIQVTHVHVEAPEITFEGGPKNNNLSKILENVQASAGGSSSDKAGAGGSGGSKKLQIDDFVLKDAKVKVSTPLTAGQSVVVSIPDIHLTNLGAGPAGATPAEVMAKVLDELLRNVLPAVQKAVTDLGKVAADIVKDPSKISPDSLDKASKGLKGLLGK
jgi:hypothetical protein